MSEEIMVRPDTDSLPALVHGILEMPMRDALEVAEDLIIADEYDAEVANTLLGKVKRAIKAVESYIDDRLKPLNQTRNLLLSDKNRLNEPLAAGEKCLKDKMTAYLSNLKRKADEDARAAQQAAQEELERRRQSEVEALKAQGEHEAAAFVAQEALTEIAPTIAVPKVAAPAGSVLKVTWSARLVSLEQLVLAIAEDIRAPTDKRRGLIALVKFDQTAANQLATGSKEHLNIPGVAAKRTETTAHTASKSTMLGT